MVDGVTRLSRRSLALFALMGVVWGIPYLLIKVAVTDLSPPTLVLFRTTIGAAILLPLALRRGEIAPLRHHWKVIAIYTLVEVAGPWLLLSHAEQRLPSSLTGLMVAGVPLIGAVLAWTTGGERLQPLALGGLVVGILGVGLLVGLDVSVTDLPAAAEVMLVAIGYALGPWIIARRLSRAPAMGVVAASLALTAVIYTPFGIILAPRTMPSVQVLVAIAVLGVVCTAVAFVAFFALIAEIGPVRATVITYVNPAVALLLGVALLHEALTAGAIAGFVLILSGSALTARRSRPGPVAMVAEP